MLADISNQQGEINLSGNYISELLNHPYFITDRNKIGELINNVSQIYLKQGNVDKYKELLFRGLRHFYTNPDERRKIYDQIRKTYRTSLKILTSREELLADRLLYFIHWIYYKIPNFSRIRFSIINKLAQKALLIFIYTLNYTFLKETSKIIFNEQKQKGSQLQFLAGKGIGGSGNKNSIRKKRILITRAMGGIGDLLMMTPGIHALKKKYPNSEIELAVPKRYFPIFENNADVKLLDIERDFFDHLNYYKWFNFTDCPAARKESMTSPKVRKSRIEIFSSALKINFFSRLAMSKKPRFIFSDDELNFAAYQWRKMELENKTVIGIQLHSDETYRDYPLMEKLVNELSKRFTVMLFDGETISGFEFENVIKIQNLPIRKAFALAHKCDLIVAPDSSFVHFAAAFDIPTIALFGPIDGKVRTKHYQNCTYLSAKEIFGCLPCWRNEEIPCKLTGMRTSECMKAIPVSNIIKTLEMKLKRNKQNA
jgi:ADP-heptose:LPS heptosyltransferase